MRYPESVIRYFTAVGTDGYEEINQVRMYPIADIRQENEDAIPGYVVCPLGYLNVASTVTGDCFCVDLNVRNSADEPRIVLVSHDEADENCPPDEIPTRMVKVADSFDEFIKRFRAGQLPSDYYDAKDAGYAP